MKSIENDSRWCLDFLKWKLVSSLSLACEQGWPLGSLGSSRYKFLPPQKYLSVVKFPPCAGGMVRAMHYVAWSLAAHILQLRRQNVPRADRSTSSYAGYRLWLKDMSFLLVFCLNGGHYSIHFIIFYVYFQKITFPYSFCMTSSPVSLFSVVW